MLATGVWGFLMDNTQNGLSRPKVHRLPKTGRRMGDGRILRIMVAGCMLVLVIGVIPLASILKKSVSHTVIATSDIPPADDNAAVVDKNLLVRNDQGQVVGQMAKIPLDAGSGMNVKTTSNADANTSKELLSIIRKY